VSHALIIDDNVILSRAVRDRLEAFGFDSFDYAWAEEQALHAAAKRRPDLIVVGDSIAEGSPLAVAKDLSREKGAPLLVVTTQSFMLQRQLRDSAELDGPHLLIDLDDALARITATLNAFEHAN
jgi:DNA-binding response OmpR family regulator